MVGTCIRGLLCLIVDRKQTERQERAGGGGQNTQEPAPLINFLRLGLLSKDPRTSPNISTNCRLNVQQLSPRGSILKSYSYPAPSWARIQVQICLAFKPVCLSLPLTYPLTGITNDKGIISLGYTPVSSVWFPTWWAESCPQKNFISNFFFFKRNLEF